MMFNIEESQKEVIINPREQSVENGNIGKWTQEQNLKYVIFLDFHKAILSSKHKKKKFKLFQEMSKFIDSRSKIQCRSHHQKLEERFENFKKIISIFKNQIGRKKYKLLYQQYTLSLPKQLPNTKKPSKIKTKISHHQPNNNGTSKSNSLEPNNEIIPYYPLDYQYFPYMLPLNSFWNGLMPTTSFGMYY